jgi:phage repressor protein C with HTH and peptisase S24 domain
VSPHQDIAARITQVREGAGFKNKEAFASALDVNVKTVSRWEAGMTVPDGASLLALSERLGVDPGWLLTGKGPAVAEAPRFGAYVPRRAEQAPEQVDDDATVLPMRHGRVRRDFVVIPRLDVMPSAGNGDTHNGDGEEVGAFAFEARWMRENLGRAGGGFVAVKVSGDSMEPTLQHGEEIVVDRTKTHVDVSGVYVFALRGDLLVKRVHRKLDGTLVVKSDNPVYEPENIDMDSAADFQVLGRVVWPRIR